MKNWELAASLDYVPASLEELKRIDYMDCKVLMIRNQRFFEAAVALSGDIIPQIIDVAKEIVAEDEIEEFEDVSLDNVFTLEDLLNSGYYGDDYESNRREFANVFVEDYLYS